MAWTRRAPVPRAATRQQRASTVLRLAIAAAATGLGAASPSALPAMEAKAREPLRRLPELRASVASAAGSAGGGEGALRLADTESLIATIYVGTPPQELRCMIDSGSADLWVTSMSCASCGGGRFFRADTSSTFSASGERAKDHHAAAVRVGYGSGWISGRFAQDTVQIGGVTLKNQSFIVAGDAQLPEHTEWDGICGLGWRRLSSEGKPFYKHLQDNGGRPIFSFVPRGGRSRGAYMAVGEEVVSACKADTLVWAPAEPVSPHEERSFWVVSGGIAIHEKAHAKVRFLVDTGSTLIEVPPPIFMSLTKSIIPASLLRLVCGVESQFGFLHCDCSVLKSKDIKPLRVQLGHREFLLPAEKLFMRMAAMRQGKATEVCLFQVQPNPDAMRRSLTSLTGRPPDGGSVGEGNMEPGEHVKEQIVRMPNGAICTNTILLNGDEVIRNVSKCEPPGETDSLASVFFPPQRRLQWDGFPESGVDMPAHDPEDDLWVLGGVFLQEFVSIYDFEKERMGFCEHANGAGGNVSHSVGYAEMLPRNALGTASAIGAAPSPSLDAGVLALAALASAAALVFAFRRGGAPGVHQQVPDNPLVATCSGPRDVGDNARDREYDC